MRDQRELAYRIYVADSINLDAQGKYMAQRFSALMRPERVDERPAEEIAHDIIARAGLEVISE